MTFGADPDFEHPCPKNTYATPHPRELLAKLEAWKDGRPKLERRVYPASPAAALISRRKAANLALSLSMLATSRGT